MSLFFSWAVFLVPGVSQPGDPDFEKQWALSNTGQEVNGAAAVPGADIQAMTAWNRHSGARPVVVAIIGGGVNVHEEFSDRLLPGYVTSLAKGDPYSTLDIGENGTRAAGVIAAARDNGMGIAGINDQVKILPVRAASDATVPAESVAEGLIWATDHGADIAVVLTQFYDFNQALADAVSHATAQNVLVIAAAGHIGGNTVAYPAAFEGCLSVAATTCQDEAASFSNFGPEVDLAAPAEFIWSTLGDEEYGYESSGNSFLAAAHVAGVASLMLSYSPGISASTIRQILFQTADDLGDVGVDEHFGAGRLNAHEALMATPTPLLRIEPLDPIPAVVQPMRTTSFSIRIINGTGTLNPTSPELVYRTQPGSFTGAVRMQALGGGLYSASLPALSCGTILEFYLLGGALSGLTVTEPAHAPLELHKVTVSPDIVLFADDFEADLGWEVSSAGTGTTGVWVREEPIGTETAQSIPVQPDYDRSEDERELCYFTGQHHGGSTGSNDVDNGPVTLTSPVIDIGQHEDVELRFACWLYSKGNSDSLIDPLIMEFSRDGGPWTTAATITPTKGWEFQTVDLSDFPEIVGSQLRVRFTVSDNPADTVTEAAIDEFSVVAKSCEAVPGDANGDGAVNLRDMGILGSCITGPFAPRTANCSAADANNDLRVDLRDVGVLLRSFHPTN